MSGSIIRWSNIVNGIGRGTRKQHKLIANRPRNWLLAIYFLACAKSVAGKELSDLETHIVHTLRSSTVGEPIIRALAQAQETTPTALREQLFPERFARLNLNHSVSFADLSQIAPSIVADTLGQPNVRNLDIAAIHAAPPVHHPMQLPPEILVQYGSPLARAVMAEAESPMHAMQANQAIANRYTIKAHGFRCLEESNESSAHDEVYWLFGSIAKGYQMTNGTKTYTYVDAGEAYHFENDEGCFWGMDCQPHTFPEGEIGAVATLIEHDHGDPSDLLEAWTTIFTSVEAILTLSGVAAWVAAVVAGIGGVGAFIIETFEDDHIDDAAWTFNRAAINEIVDKHGGSYDVVELFTDKDSRYRLRIRVTRQV